MKKALLAIGLALSSVLAQAGPLDDVAAAFQQATAQAQANDKAHPQAVSETVIRGYIASTTGLLRVTAAESYIGALATRPQAEQAIAASGYTYVTTQHRMDVYKRIDPANDFGSILLVYYNAAGYCSEVYLINDTI